MRSFFKTTIAAFIGTLLAIVLLVGIGIVIFINASPKPEKVKSKSILTLDLSLAIPELTDNLPKDDFPISMTKNIGLNDIKKAIRSAAKDPNITGIVLKTKWMLAGQATVYSIVEELEKFKESGKFLWAYADMYSQSAYWVASAADSIFMNPNGMIDLKGYGASKPYYKEVMDKLGVKMNIFYAGKYKSATEPYRRTSMSNENREQLNEFLGDMKSIMVSSISSHRNIQKNELESIIKNYSGGHARSALKTGLVDTLVFLDDFNERLLKKVGGDELHEINVKKYLASGLKNSESKNDDKIAIVYTEGVISYNNEDPGAISEKRYESIINDLIEDSNIKAVVLRINSPGGNSFDSDNLHEDILRLRKSGKKVIASIGDYAASGGYYLACAADTIVALPNSLTGSIGVYIMFPNFSNMLNEKIGIKYDTVKTDPMSISFSEVQDLTSMEKEYLKNTTDDLYGQFLKRVSEGRNMPIEAIDAVAQGRVWSGIKAKQLNLVDEIGNLDDAIKIAARAVGIEDYSIVSFPKVPKSPLEKIASEILQGSVKQPSLELTEIEKELFQIHNLLRQFSDHKVPQARLPFFFHWD